MEHAAFVVSQEQHAAWQRLIDQQRSLDQDERQLALKPGTWKISEAFSRSEHYPMLFNGHRSHG